MKRHYSLSFVASMLINACYLTFALLAFTRYPLSYSPQSNWLSDLGSANLNPSGALFYNIGIVASGGMVLLFFLGLSQWKMEKNRMQKLMLYVTQGFGILGAIAMIMSGFYPINFFTLHSFFSTCLNILLGTAFAFSVAALRYHPACPRWLLVLGVLTALAALLFGIFHTVYVLEWITIAFFLCYVALLGVQMKLISSETMKHSTTLVTR